MSAPTGFAASPAGYRLPTPDRFLELLAAGQAAFAATLAAADLDAPVPDCPGWTLRRLGWHLGTVHRWAAGAVEQGRPVEREEVGPDGRDALVDWYREGADGLLTLLRRTDPDAATWTFGPKPRTVRFWCRRQAHETAVHVQDAARAAGALVAALPVDLAVDGVDEVVTMFFPRQVHLGRTGPLPGSLALEPVEAGGLRWVLAGDGAVGSDDLPAADAILRGPADLLVRLLWRRVGLDGPDGADGLVLEGDRAAAVAVLAAGLTP